MRICIERFSHTPMSRQRPRSGASEPRTGRGNVIVCRNGKTLLRAMERPFILTVAVMLSTMALSQSPYDHQQRQRPRRLTREQAENLREITGVRLQSPERLLLHRRDLSAASHTETQTLNSTSDKAASSFKPWSWSTRSSETTAQFRLTLGGGGGIKLPATIYLSEVVHFTVSNCTFVERGDALPTPGEGGILEGSSFHRSPSGSTEVCAPCNQGQTAYGSLHRAKDGNVVSANYLNCSHGNHTFTFKLESDGIWDLRVFVGHENLESTIVRVEPTSASVEKVSTIQTQLPDENHDHATRPPLLPSAAARPDFHLIPPGFAGTQEGVQGLVSVETKGWIGGSLAVEGLNGSLCGRDLGLVVSRDASKSYNGTVLACRGIGLDPITGRTKVFGGFGLAKGNNVSSSLACTRSVDAEGRCEVYFLTYKAPQWGEYTATFIMDGLPLLAGPYRAVIFPPPSYPWFNTSTLVAARDDWQYMDSLEFSVLPRNSNGERIDTCDAHVKAKLQRGDVTVRANVSCEVQQHAVYSLLIEQALGDGIWTLTALMEGEDVMYSPLQIEIRPGVSARYSRVSGEGLQVAVAGQPADVYLRLTMHNDVPARDCREPVFLIAVQKWLTDAPAAEIESGSASTSVAQSSAPTHKSTSGELVQCSGGEYHLSYSVTAAGNYTLSVLIGKHKELVDGTPLEVEVFPGALSSQHCGIVGNSLGSGTLLYGGFCRFGLYLRDPFGNYISCAHYFRGLTKHNISELSVYHEMGDEASSSAWSVPATVGRCHNQIYTEGTSQIVDGVLDVSFQLPKTKGDSVVKEIALDLEVSVNGKRLKQGPFTTNIRPPRLSSQKCYVFGDGTRGAEPGEEKVLVMQLVNELEENVTSCGSLATISGAQRCSSLQTEAACIHREDCDWTVLNKDTGACSSKEEHELVEVYLTPLEMDASDEEGLKQLSGMVKACDHGLYQLSYTVKEQGRFHLHVLVGGKEAKGSPFRIMIAPGCRSGAVTFPCTGRGVCLEDGQCTCTSGYLGGDCERECPGLDDDGRFCSGRGNCTDSGECLCLYGFIGRICHLECPGGSGNVCSGNGLCLEGGECQCLSGYGGERCQFKRREVQKFGSMSALVIILAMMTLTVILIGCVVVKNRAKERRMGSYGTVVNDEDEIPGEYRRAQTLLDRCADGVLDCVSFADGMRTRRSSKGTDSTNSSTPDDQIAMIEME